MKWQTVVHVSINYFQKKRPKKNSILFLELRARLVLRSSRDNDRHATPQPWIMDSRHATIRQWVLRRMQIIFIHSLTALYTAQYSLNKRWRRRPGHAARTRIRRTYASIYAHRMHTRPAWRHCVFRRLCAGPPLRRIIYSTSARGSQSSRRRRWRRCQHSACCAVKKHIPYIQYSITYT